MIAIGHEFCRTAGAPRGRTVALPKSTLDTAQVCDIQELPGILLIFHCDWYGDSSIEKFPPASKVIRSMEGRGRKHPCQGSYSSTRSNPADALPIRPPIWFEKKTYLIPYIWVVDVHRRWAKSPWNAPYTL